MRRRSKLELEASTREESRRRRISLREALFRILLALVLLAPLPLGSVYPLAYSLMAAVVGVLLIAHSLSVWRAPDRMMSDPSLFAWLALFLIAAGWAALQASPITPLQWHHPLWGEAASALKTDIAGAVSLNPFETFSGLMRLLTYGGIFWLGLQLCRSSARAETVFLCFSVAGFAYAVYGLSVKFAETNMVLWYPNPYYRDTVTSTFVNRNNYAAYAGLGLVCTTGMIVKIFFEALSSYPGRGARFLALIDGFSGWRWLLLPSWVALITALLLTGSRAGVVSSLAGTLVLVALASTASASVRRRHALIAVGLIALSSLALILFSGEKVGERLAYQIAEPQERSALYELTLKEIARNPWLGTGYGTFEEAIRIARDDRLKHGYYDKAHNTYLENALELGIPAELLIVMTLSFLFLCCVAGVRRAKREAIYSCIGIATTLQIALHSLVDFPLQIPALAAAYALIMGAAVAHSRSYRELQPPVLA